MRADGIFQHIEGDFKNCILLRQCAGPWKRCDFRTVTQKKGLTAGMIRVITKFLLRVKLRIGSISWRSLRFNLGFWQRKKILKRKGRQELPQRPQRKPY